MTGGNPDRYAGLDRRHRPLSHAGPPTGQTFTIVSAALLIGGLAVPFVLGHVTALSTSQLSFVVLRVVAALLLLAAGLMNLIRWRMTGEAALALIGTAVVLYGALGVLPALLRSTLPPGHLSVLRLAHAVLVMTLLAWAMWTPQVSSRVRPAHLISLGCCLSAAVLVMLGRHLVPAAMLTNARFPARVAMALTAVWLTLGATAFVLSRLRQQARLSWLGLALISLAFSEAVLAAAFSHPGSWLVASGSLRALAGAVCCFAAARELLVVMADQGESLLRLDDRLNSAMARLDAAHARDEERTHDARAALCAVQSAISTLTGFYERLETETRAQLEQAVESELTRLRRLLDDPGNSDFEYFELASAIQPVITAYRSYGMSIDVQASSFCWVNGRPADTATVVQSLLENARRHAPGSPVIVRISRVDGAVVLAVEDQGPGVPLVERDTIFNRGMRGQRARHTPGTGLGLFIAARLMHDQLGDIALRDGLDGGACFTLTFAIASQRVSHAVDDMVPAQTPRLVARLDPA
jgi:signal transduction histidine kinase